MAGFGFVGRTVLSCGAGFETQVHEQKRQGEILFGIVLIPRGLHRFIGLAAAAVIRSGIYFLRVLVIGQD